MRYTHRALGKSTGPAGKRLRARSGVLYASASGDNGLDKLNRIQGRFANTQTQVAAVNRRLAEELADAMVEELHRSLVRRAASTKRLENALVDPRNRVANQKGFGVGNADFLDNSDAKYWRAIELGTRHFVGKKIRGVWGESWDGAMGGNGRYGAYPIFGPRYTAFGAGRGGRLVPMKRSQALRLLRASGAGNGTGRPATEGIIRRPIEPHHYMRDAWTNFDMRGKAREAVRDVFTQAGLPVPKLGKGAHRR